MPEEDIDGFLTLSNQQRIGEDSPPPLLLTLDLRENNLSRLPSNFTKLSTLLLLPLQELNISNNPSVGEDLPLLSSQVCSLSHLSSLKLSNCGLKSVPHPLTRLQQLELLDLSHNQLTTIPTSITTLTSLTTLYIHENHLRTIPLEIGYLPHLDYFWCFSNRLVSPLDSLAPPLLIDGISGDELYNHSRRAIALLRACLEGTEKYRQIKLILIGNGQEGKVSRYLNIQYYAVSLHI